MSKLSVLFRVDGNSYIGLGHIFRCIALAEMIRDDFNCFFAISDPDRTTSEIIESKKFTLLKLPSVIYCNPDNRNEKDEIPFDLNGYLIENNISIVVLDGYWFGENYQKALRKHKVKIAVIEDNGFGKYNADIIINHAPGLNREDYQIDNNNSFFALGPEFALIRPSFLKSKVVIRKEYSTVNNIFICFGGADFYNYTHKITKLILDNFNYNISIVLGSTYSFKEELEALQIHYPDRLKIRQNLSEDDLLTEMQLSDVGIVPASGILFESIAARLPVISGMYTENQKKIYEGFLERGVFIDAYNFTDKHLLKALNQLTVDKLKVIVHNQKLTMDKKNNERLREVFNNVI